MLLIDKRYRVEHQQSEGTKILPGKMLEKMAKIKLGDRESSEAVPQPLGHQSFTGITNYTIVD